MKLAIERGTEFEADGKRYVVAQVLDFEAVLAQDTDTGRVDRIAIADMRKPIPRTEESHAQLPDLAALDGEDWDEARRRQKVIQGLIEMPRRPRADVERAAVELGVDAATVYRWMQTYRNDARLSSLLPAKHHGGRGGSRLDPQTERMIVAGINEYYLTRQQHSVRSTFEQIRRLCKAEGVKVPHENTVRARIDALSEKTKLKKRGHAKAAYDKFDPRPGAYDEAKHPLAVVQIDHTLLDISLVDSQDRLPIGRPWITLAFDVYSRMVTGFYVSLDPPSAHSTGLAIAHSVLPKETWLAKRGISQKWPVWGFPTCIHFDNAKEFHGEMLRRACEQYSIRIDHRPVAVPHFGGHIERMLGTLAKELHKLPGTTFESPKRRGDYDSDARAVMTLEELEIWIAEFITGVYHARIHKGISSAPIDRWSQALLGDGKKPGVGMPSRPVDEERIQLDFSPHINRTIQPYGVMADEISYYSEVLRPYIAAKDGRRKKSFIFRRDPRDISRLYFWDPATTQYCEIPYRDLTRPAISVWELREIRRRLQEEGKKNIDEDAIFATLERLREKAERAVTTTKKVRRQRERRPRTVVTTTVKTGIIPSPKPALPFIEKRKVPIVPFEVEDV